MSLTAFILSCHNIIQFLLWSLALYLIDSYIRTGSPPCWKEALQLAQCEQCLEVIFSITRMTKNNPFTVFVQTVARACIVCIIMPLIWHDSVNEKWVFMAAIPWCIGEMVRYPFYEFKSLQPYLGHLRYNVFIPLYPIGVLGELICFYQ